MVVCDSCSRSEAIATRPWQHTIWEHAYLIEIRHQYVPELCLGKHKCQVWHLLLSLVRVLAREYVLTLHPGKLFARIST